MVARDLKTEMAFGTDVVRTPPKANKIADLKEILDSHKNFGFLPIPGTDSSIKVRYIGALEWLEVERKYPPISSRLTGVETNMLSTLYRKSVGKNRLDWINSLTDPEKDLLKKVEELDRPLSLPRSALLLSIMAVEPKISEEKAIELFNSFRTFDEVDAFFDQMGRFIIGTQEEINGEELKN